MKRHFVKLLLLIASYTLVACGGSSSNDSSFTLTSKDYSNGGKIPVIHADDSALGETQDCANGDAENLSPQYTWRNAPEETVSYALIMDDETPPCGEDESACPHWAVYNIPASVKSFDRGVDTSEIQGVVEAGLGSYMGPCPPPNDKHTYTTTIYALNIDLGLVADTMFTRAEFESSFNNEILDKADITGTYEYTPQD